MINIRQQTINNNNINKAIIGGIVTEKQEPNYAGRSRREFTKCDSSPASK